VRLGAGLASMCSLAARVNSAVCWVRDRAWYCARAASSQQALARGSSTLVALLIVSLSGCVGSGTAPMIQAPLFRRAGQVEGGLTWRPTPAGAELGAAVRGAVTDQLRVGGSLSTTSRGQSDRIDASARHPALYTEGFFGAEAGGLLLRFGALLGSGFGQQQRFASACAGLPARACQADGRLMRDRYVRGYGQLHVGIAPPGLLSASLALRLPVIIDVADELPRRRTRVTSEVALTHSFTFRFLRLDLQPLWSRDQGFTFHLALLFRFTPGPG
jgi:hypothetical protein